MRLTLRRRDAVAIALVIQAVVYAPVRAQEPDCQLLGSPSIVIGGSIDIDWRQRAGFSCAFRMSVGFRHNLESIAVMRRARHGRAGASTDRRVDESGRITLLIAYQSPAGSRAERDEFTVRAITRDRESGSRATTHLTYRIQMWR